MQRVTLSDFAAEKGQMQAAKLLGIWQGAVHKALKMRREIYVTLQEDGTYTAEEVRPFPSRDGSGKRITNPGG